MDSGTWVEKAVAAIVTWGAWATTRLFHVMTRKEHAAVCEGNEKRLHLHLDRIFDALEKLDTEATHHRHNVQNQLAQMGRDMAALNERSNSRRSTW